MLETEWQFKLKEQEIAGEDTKLSISVKQDPLHKALIAVQIKSSSLADLNSQGG